MGPTGDVYDAHLPLHNPADCEPVPAILQMGAEVDGRLALAPLSVLLGVDLQPVQVIQGGDCLPYPGPAHL